MQLSKELDLLPSADFTTGSLSPVAHLSTRSMTISQNSSTMMHERKLNRYKEKVERRRTRYEEMAIYLERKVQKAESKAERLK